MARGRRWSTNDLRHQFPLPHERQLDPRIDGVYVIEDPDEFSLRFHADGQVSMAGEQGSWSIEAGDLHLSTPRWQCEGALDHETAYLLCSAHHDRAERLQLVLGFRPDP